MTKLEGYFTVRQYPQLYLFGVVLFGIAAVAANPYLQPGNASGQVVSSAGKDHKRYSADMKDLRIRFNKDKGKVRLLMLLSPT